MHLQLSIYYIVVSVLKRLRFCNFIREEFGSENSDEIDKLYERVARMAIGRPNSLEIVVAAEIDIFGRDEDVDLLDYYIIKYVNTHVHAVSLA